VSDGWRREERPDVAVDRILDAAEKVFVEVGVSAAGMARIADAAGCSRGTLYRYFESRHALHVAYVDRASRRIVERVRERAGRIDDPRRRLVESILEAVREVRHNPATAAWFEPGVSGLAARMGRSSEVTEALATAFVARLLGARRDDPESRLRARWVVRVVISLLGMPGESEAEERALVERFVAPALLGEGGRRGRR
jgi:AcrR family transcriptional regulator